MRVSTFLIKKSKFAIVTINAILLISAGCDSQQESQRREKMTGPNSMTIAKIIRAAAATNESNILDKSEFLELMESVKGPEAEQIEQLIFGRDVPNGRTERMQAFRATHFNGFDLSQLKLKQLGRDDLNLIWKYTSDALEGNRFEFVPSSSIKDAANQDLFTDNMVSLGAHVYLCLGADQKDPKIEGVKVINLPKPTKTKDGLGYMPGSALNGKQCIVYVPKPWFGAGSQHKGFYPHDYSVSLNMLIELANAGDKEFVDMIGYSFDNFKALAETIGHIPNANKSWSIGDTSRTQTNTLASQVLLYAGYLGKTNGAADAKKWLEDVGLPIAQNNLAFLTADRAKTAEGLYLFVPIGKSPDAKTGDTYAYTSEMHNSPVLHNFYFERLLVDLVTTYEGRSAQANYCTTSNCLKYIEEVSDTNIIKALRVRDLSKLIDERAKLQGLDAKDVTVRTKFAGEMKGRIFVWDHPVRGEELIVKSPSGKYYRLTNYAIGSDQAMRASGFDPSDMAGINSLDALDTAYAGHNAQLFRQLQDMAKMYRLLGKVGLAQAMDKKAAGLKQAMMKNMWSTEHGELVPYNRESGQVDYRFFDMSYALWAGLFDTGNPVERARLMSTVRNIPDYEGPEGPYASTDWSGHNWGWGKVWPVMAGYSVMGLQDYSKVLLAKGFTKEAKLCADTAQRIALKWLYSNAEMFAKAHGFGENLAVRKDGKPLENAYGYNIKNPDKNGNYTWHVVITRWLYTQLNSDSKRLFDTFYSALKEKHPKRL
jgi:hypothetical protein